MVYGLTTVIVCQNIPSIQVDTEQPRYVPCHWEDPSHRPEQDTQRVARSHRQHCLSRSVVELHI